MLSVRCSRFSMRCSGFSDTVPECSGGVPGYSGVPANTTCPLSSPVVVTHHPSRNTFSRALAFQSGHKL